MAGTASINLDSTAPPKPYLGLTEREDSSTYRYGRAILIVSLASALGLVGLAFVRTLGTGVVDYPITSAINALAHRWRALDYALLLFERFNAPKGVALFALAYGAFVANSDALARLRLVLGCVAASAAAAASRIIQMGLPHLPRPMYDPSLHFQPPFGADTSALHDWSSYPSDNASLLFGVALATWFADRRMGVLGMALFAISAFARIYGGLHFTTDIAGGCLLSAALVCAAQSAWAPAPERLDRLGRRYAPWLAVLAFFIAAQAASLFDEVRAVAALVKSWMA
jgi:undecaprenyl-diphosphatase